MWEMTVHIVFLCLYAFLLRCFFVSVFFCFGFGGCGLWVVGCGMVARYPSSLFYSFRSFRSFLSFFLSFFSPTQNTKHFYPRAKSPEKLREMFEAELDQLKETRSSLESTEGDEGDAPLMLGMEGKQFTFDVDSPCEVTFAACSAKKGGKLLEAVREFISGAL